MSLKGLGHHATGHRPWEGGQQEGHVIEGYYYDDAEGRPGCYTLLDSNKVSVPTHMLIIVDGFEMELATAQAKGGKSKASRKRSDAQVFKLSSSVREAIVRALPEPWTEESL